MVRQDGNYLRRIKGHTEVRSLVYNGGVDEFTEGLCQSGQAGVYGDRVFLHNDGGIHRSVTATLLPPVKRSWMTGLRTLGRLW